MTKKTMSPMKTYGGTHHAGKIVRTPIVKLLLSLCAPFVFCSQLLGYNLSPNCRLAAPEDFVAVTPETPQTEIGPEQYRNVQYFFKNNNNVNVAYIIIFKNKLLDYPGVSFVFPDKGCKTGCEALILRTDGRRVLAKYIFFVSHMVMQPDMRPYTEPEPRAPVVIFLDQDGDGLVSVMKKKTRGGMYISEVHEVRPGSSGLHAWSTAYRSCLLRGKFDFFETLPRRPQ